MVDNETRGMLMHLRSLLGSTIIASIAGSKNRHVVDEWIDGESIPSDEVLERLEVTLEVFSKVATNKGDDVARLWILGANCNGYTTTPVTELRAANFHTVRSSAARIANPEEMGL